MEFTLTEDHLKLLKNMYVGWLWCEFGSPEIDPKRPYGNSDVIGDIHEILTGHYSSREDISEELEEKYNKLHKETETALQIVLNTLSFVPGQYRKINPYDKDWELIEKKTHCCEPEFDKPEIRMTPSGVAYVKASDILRSRVGREEIDRISKIRVSGNNKRVH